MAAFDPEQTYEPGIIKPAPPDTRTLASRNQQAGRHAHIL